MSKANITIEFDQPERVYRAGDEVAGKVTANVNNSVDCELELRSFWKTHGRGNRDTDVNAVQTLFKGSWQPGQSYSYEFAFEAPSHPFTYHGNYLNIDHYVRAQAKVRWAFDPKCEEEFLLVAGPAECAEARAGEIEEKENKYRGCGSTALVLVGLVATVVTVCVGLFGTFLAFLALPIGLVLLFLGLRNTMAKYLLGDVKVDAGSRVVNPLQEIPVVVSFQPKRSFSNAKVKMFLRGSEVCVSGSGSNRTTHTHKLFEQTYLIGEVSETRANEEIKITDSIKLPPTDAYSVDFSENKIIWKLTTKIEIPMWPDWTQHKTLWMTPVPNSGSSIGTPPFDDGNAGTPGKSGFSFDLDGQAGVVTVADGTSPDLPTAGTLGAAELLNVLGKLADFDRFSNEADNLIAQKAEEIYRFDVQVNRVSSNYGEFQDPNYRNGRTIHGEIPDSDFEALVQLPDSYNQPLDKIQPGDVFQIQAVMIKWDGLYQRIELLGF